MRRYVSEMLLLIATTIWGLAFVWQSIASRELGALTVVGVRSIIAAIFLSFVVICVPTIYRSQEPKIKLTRNRYQGFLLSFICGLALFFAMYVQQVGLEHTTASKTGFISVLYICIVPLITICFGEKLNKFFLIGLIISLIGLYFLSIKGDFSLEYGDLVVLASAVLYAIHILVVGYSAGRVNSMFLSIGQLFVVSVLSLTTAYFSEHFNLSSILSVILPLLALGILSSGVGYTFQIVAQRDVPSHTASLIMSFESVVAAIGGVVILGEILSIREMIGMVLVLGGILLSQKK
ncbi:DMT family transporter [Gemella sp. GH3]|uniref:DMT family transporter n=1 Tax=unclassified Gemella TaxID=2624949 RepID=UPI0015D00CD0|nr:MULTISPECIES: DMT family transporter [unclassified Gemella]MBF0713366.1 DMT family transporter [Gemella sp. GH3.1]NYS50318.1 DMT family transporter [Gemella sp. GH3]